MQSWFRSEPQRDTNVAKHTRNSSLLSLAFIISLAACAPKGEALYVVDFGAIAMVPSGIGALPKPFPGTGTVWAILPAPPR